MINLESKAMIDDFASWFSRYFPQEKDVLPWRFTQNIASYINARIDFFAPDYIIKGNVAVHKGALVEEHVVLKGPVIICDKCFVGAHAYLRGGVFLAPNVSIGPGCEIKSSAILTGSALAHFNFVGDSIIGSNVNFEAGSIVANYHNDREDKTIYVRMNDEKVKTDVTKFGGLIGDNCRIGANAVLSPGTILPKGYIVKRLELIQHY